MEWFGTAEQAINAIYLLGDHPDLLCGEIIKVKAQELFSDSDPTTDDNARDEPTDQCTDENAMDIDQDEQTTQQTASTQPTSSVGPPLKKNPFELSQLLFVVGHVALKQTVHLEVVESVWKRKKSAKTGEQSGSDGYAC
jgi:condensin complex subunit 1